MGILAVRHFRKMRRDPINLLVVRGKKGFRCDLPYRTHARTVQSHILYLPVGKRSLPACILDELSVSCGLESRPRVMQNQLHGKPIRERMRFTSSM